MPPRGPGIPGCNTECRGHYHDQVAAGPFSNLTQRYFQRLATVDGSYLLSHGVAHDAVRVGIGEQRDI